MKYLGAFLFLCGISTMFASAKQKERLFSAWFGGKWLYLWRHTFREIYCFLCEFLNGEIGHFLIKGDRKQPGGDRARAQSPLSLCGRPMPPQRGVTVLSSYLDWNNEKLLAAPDVGSPSCCDLLVAHGSHPPSAGTVPYSLSPAASRRTAAAGRPEGGSGAEVSEPYPAFATSG